MEKSFFKGIYYQKLQKNYVFFSCIKLSLNSLSSLITTSFLKINAIIFSINSNILFWKFELFLDAFYRVIWVWVHTWYNRIVIWIGFFVIIEIFFFENFPFFFHFFLEIFFFKKLFWRGLWTLWWRGFLGIFWNFLLEIFGLSLGECDYVLSLFFRISFFVFFNFICFLLYFQLLFHNLQLLQNLLLLHQ